MLRGGAGLCYEKSLYIMLGEDETTNGWIRPTLGPYAKFAVPKQRTIGALFRYPSHA